MRLFDLLKLIADVSNKTGIPCYIVGGAPRDKLLGISEKIGDIDLTSGNHRVSELARSVEFELRKIVTNFVVKESKDGHISFHLPEIKIDWSSNFIVPAVKGVLKRKNIPDSSLNEEVWSRDFSCNSLLMSLDFIKVSDPTKLGIPDIKNKIVRTILDPELAFRYNTNRIIRVVYMACKLGFTVSPDIVDWIKKHPRFIKESTPEYLTKTINKSMHYDKARCIQLLGQMNMWDYIPISKELQPYYNKYLVLESIKERG